MRKFVEVKYDTHRVPRKKVTQEENGTVMFLHGWITAHLYDHDIYVDGRIFVNGIDKVLFPPEEE